MAFAVYFVTEKRLRMNMRLFSILVLIFSGTHANLAWFGFGGRCSACSDKVCQADFITGCSASSGRLTHEHEGDAHAYSHNDDDADSCKVKDGECTCSLHPSDLPNPKSGQPFLLEQTSPVDQVRTTHQILSFVIQENELLPTLSAGLAVAPPSHATRRAQLSVWRT